MENIVAHEWSRNASCYMLMSEASNIHVGNISDFKCDTL